MLLCRGFGGGRRHASEWSWMIKPASLAAISSCVWYSQGEAFPPKFLGASPHATVHEIDTVEWRIDKWSAFQPRKVCSAIRAVVQVKGDTPVFGNGVLISSQGYVLTCAHLIHNNKNVCVEFADNQTYRTRLVAVDWDADLALLQVIGQPAGRFYEWFNDVIGVDYRRALKEQKSQKAEAELKSKILGHNNRSNSASRAAEMVLEHSINQESLEALLRAQQRRRRTIEELSEFIYATKRGEGSGDTNSALDRWKQSWKSLNLEDRLYRLYHRLLERNWHLKDEDQIGGERIRAAIIAERRGVDASEEMRAMDLPCSSDDEKWTQTLSRILKRTHALGNPLDLASHEVAAVSQEKYDPFLRLMNYYESSDVSKQRIKTARIPLRNYEALPSSLYVVGINPPSVEYSTLNIVRMLPDITNAVPVTINRISKLDSWRGTAARGEFFGKRLDESSDYADDSYDPDICIIRMRPSPMMNRPGSPVLDNQGNLVGLLLRGDTKYHDALDLTKQEAKLRLEALLNFAVNADQDQVKSSKPATVGDFGCYYHFRPYDSSIMIDEVSTDSPADKVGFVAGDKITRLNGKAIQSAYDLSRILKDNLTQSRGADIELQRWIESPPPPLCTVDFDRVEKLEASANTVLSQKSRHVEPSSTSMAKQLRKMYGPEERQKMHIHLK